MEIRLRLSLYVGLFLRKNIIRWKVPLSDFHFAYPATHCCTPLHYVFMLETLNKQADDFNV